MKTESSVSFHLLPRLLAGERVVHCQPWLWVASTKSLPSYRVSESLPLLQEMGFYHTQRRRLLTCWLFRLVRFDWVAWFGRREDGAERDSIKEVSVGRSPVLGRYLQIVTCNPVKHWWRSCEGRIRLFMENPEPLYRWLTEALRAAPPGADQNAAAAVQPAGL
jgi:hypothetical protein